MGNSFLRLRPREPAHMLVLILHTFVPCGSRSLLLASDACDKASLCYKLH